MEKAALLADQYADASNLGTRGEFNGRYTVGDTHPHDWVFDHVSAPADARVLDVGCGPGSFWARSADRVPENWRPTLVDFSPGMVRAASDREAVAALEPALAVGDAERLPFDDGAFDACLALQMLYHVPDREAAIGELRRVLADDGRLYATTGAAGNAATLYDLLREVSTGRVEPLSGEFTGANGADQLESAFGTVERQVMENAVRVADPDAVVAYALSMPLEDPRLAGFDPEDAEALRAVVADRIDEEGRLTWQKDMVLFVAEP